MSVLREIGIIARALRSISLSGTNSGESGDYPRGTVGAAQGGSLNGCPLC